MVSADDTHTVAAPVSRRDEVRIRTLAEIKERALEQVTEGGPDAVSLNAVARAMRMSGPALYRYFSSRDELVATLVADSYDHLADTLAAAAHGAAGRPARERLRVVAAAYRSWALEQPHRYRLTFMSTAGSGELEPQRIVPAAHRSMTTFLDVVADLPAGTDAVAPALADQLDAWHRSRSGRGADQRDGHTAEALQRGVLAWTRLHGLLSLELQGAFAMMNVDAEMLYEHEVSGLAD